MAKKSKKVNKPQTVNESILNSFISRAIYLERYKAYLTQQLVKYFNKDIVPVILQHILNELEEGASYSQVRNTISKCNRVFNEKYQSLNIKMYAEMEEFAEAESDWLSAAIKKPVPFAIALNTPSPALIKNVIEKSPIDGQLMADLLKNMKLSTQKKVARQIRLGMIEGESIDKIVRRIKGTKAMNYSDGIFVASRRDIEAIVRTSVAGVSNNIRSEMYAENTDIIDKEQFTATLDNRTSKTCIALDGQIFEIGKGPHPPLHIRCRSLRVPVLKSWEELGFKGLKGIPGTTRASMDGQVPATLNYGDWLKKQSQEEQEKILGKGVAELFAEGRIGVKDLVDQKYNPISLKNLKKINF